MFVRESGCIGRRGRISARGWRLGCGVCDSGVLGVEWGGTEVDGFGDASYNMAEEAMLI